MTIQIVFYLLITAGLGYLWIKLFGWLSDKVSDIRAELAQDPTNANFDLDPESDAWSEAGREDISEQLQDEDRLKQRTKIYKMQSGWESWSLSGVVASLEIIPSWIVFLILGLVFSLPLWLPPLTFFLLVFTFALWLYSEERVTIPTVHEGELKFRGGRKKIILEEGDHWLPPGFDVEIVDMQERTIDIEPFWVKSQDGVRVKVTPRLQWHPVNAHDYLEVEDHEDFLGNFTQSVIRGVVAGNSAEEAQTGDGGNLIYKRLTRTIASTSEEDQRGIMVDTVDIGDVSLPEAIEEAQEEEQKAKHKKKAKEVDLTLFVEQTTTLLDKFPSLTGKLAANLVLVNQGKMDKKELDLDIENLENFDLGKALSLLP